MWQLSIVHLATNNNTHCLLILLFEKLVLALIEDIVIQSEPEKQDKNQISEKIFYVSESELKFLQRVRLWNKNFTTRQILKKNIF